MSNRLKWKTESGSSGVKGHGQRWDLSRDQGKTGFPLLPWDLPEFCVAFWCQICVWYWMSWISWFYLKQGREDEEKWWTSATEVFVAYLFLWYHLSLLRSSPVMELDIFFPRGSRVCFCDLIIRLADHCFFAPCSVFVILLKLVEVLCLQEENCCLLEFIISIFSDAGEANAF